MTKHGKLKIKGNPDGSRRYDPGEHPTYDREYDQRAQRSFILNDKVRKNDFNNAWRMGDANACRGTLMTLEGSGTDNPGYYRKGSTWYKAHLPAAKEELKRVHLEHKRWQKEQVRKGLFLEPPQHWPEELLEKRLTAEAVFDVYMRERYKLLKKIKQFKARHEKEREERFLPHGPITTSFNPQKMEIDGQDVDFNPDGVPYICDDRSPYLGMPIKYYIEMARQWKTKMRLNKDQLREDGRKLFKQQKAEHEKKSDKPFPFSKMAFTPGKMFERRIKEITRDDWPEVPAGSLIDDVEKEVAQ